MDLHEFFTEDWQWDNEQTIEFWWRSQTGLPDGGTDIATLVGRALSQCFQLHMQTVKSFWLEHIYTRTNRMGLI